MQGHRHIAVIGGWMGDLYSQTVVSGVRATAIARHASVLCFTGSDLPTPAGNAALNRVYDLATKEVADGVVVLSMTALTDAKHLPEVAKRFAPLPLVSVGVPSPGIPSVGVDNESGLRTGIDHLVGVHGAKQIAFIGGPEQNAEARIRYRVYCDAMMHHGHAVEPQLIAQVPLREVTGEEAMEAILRRAPTLDAVVCANDALALGALRALSRLGKRVPSEVSVIGFDDEPAAATAVPALTTVRQPVFELGQSAADTLLDWLATGSPAPDAMVPTELVIRHSCGCMPHLRPESRPPRKSAGTSWPPIRTPAELERLVAQMDVPSKQDLRALFEALGQDIASGRADRSLHVLAETMVEFGSDAVALGSWRRVLDVIHDMLLPNLDRGPREIVGALLYEGQSLLADAVVRACRTDDRVRHERLQMLVAVVSRLPDGKGVDAVLDDVHAGLRELELAGCQIVLAAASGEAGRLVLCRRAGERVALPTEGVPVRPGQLFADGFEPGEPSFTLVVPLATGDAYYGYALFDERPEQWLFCTAIAHQVSACLTRFAREAEIERLTSDKK